MGPWEAVSLARVGSRGLVSRAAPAWVAFAALTLTACVPREPTVVVYVSDAPELAEWLGDAFASAHPDEVLRVEALTGKDALARLRQQGAGPVADVWLAAPNWLLAQATAESLLAAAPPSWAGDVPDAMRDAQGRWTGWVADPMVLAFNPDGTSRSRAPGDWIDLFHPRWSEDVLLPDVQGSPAMEAFVGTVVARMRTEASDDPGFDWLARLDANRKSYVADPEELVRRLRSGEASLALLSLSQAESAKEAAWSVDFRVPESGAPTLVRGVAVVALAPHPAGAAAFTEWLGRPEVRAAVAHRFVLLPATSGDVEGEPSWAATIRANLPLEVAPADTLAAKLDGWLTRWRDEVMGRTPLVF